MENNLNEIIKKMKENNFVKLTDDQLKRIKKILGDDSGYYFHKSWQGYILYKICWEVVFETQIGQLHDFLNIKSKKKARKHALKILEENPILDGACIQYRRVNGTYFEEYVENQINQDGQ